MNFIEQKFTVHVDGRRWQLFDIEFDTADGKFSTYIYALSHEHAEMILTELKASARIGGQIVGAERA
jgi:hypothetical protein